MTQLKTSLLIIENKSDLSVTLVTRVGRVAPYFVRYENDNLYHAMAHIRGWTTDDPPVQVKTTTVYDEMFNAESRRNMERVAAQTIVAGWEV